MKRLIAALALAVMFFGLPGFTARPALAQSAAAPTAGDLQARVSSIVDRFPGDTAAATTALAAELVALGPAGLARVCALVLPPGAGNDAKARFAVNGLAVHVTRAGAEPERLMLSKALLAAVAGSGDKNVIAFFLAQLQLCGRVEAIKPLARFLPDKDLAAPAAAALQTIGGPEAGRVFLKALDAAPPAAKLSIVDALGALRSREAVKKLLALTDDPDEGLRRATRYALANIGDPSAGPALAKVRVAASWTERAEAPGLYLLYARRLKEAGRTSEALEAGRAVLNAYAGAGESQLGADALTLIVSLLGNKGAFADLVKAVDGPSPALRAVALRLALSGPDLRLIVLPDGTDRVEHRPIGSWIEKAKTGSPEIRAAIVSTIGQDILAWSYVSECLGDPDKSVRLAAIRTLHPRPGNARDLFPLLGAADAEEAAVLKAKLLQYRSEFVVPEAARLLYSIPHPGKAVLIDLLGEKGARSEYGRVLELAGDPDPATRAAAIGALAKLVGEGDLPDLVGLLEKATDADDIVNLQNAVAAAARSNPDQALRGAALIGLLKDAAPARKAVILRVLPKVGGAKGLAAAVAETANTDSQIQTAAVYALSQWPEYAAADELLRIATTTASKRFRLLAVEGYVRLVGRGDLTGQRKLALFQDLMAKPFDEADKKPILAAAAEIREPEALRLLAASLDNPVLGEAAAAGLLELASEQDPHERWLSGQEAYSVLRRVEARTADPAERERTAALITARLRQGGFVPLFDGRTLNGWKGLVADPPARAKMTPEQLAAAQAAADDRMRAHWQVVDGVLVFDGKGESLCTSADYGDFELLVDWKIDKGGDSGLYLRGSPQVQIWDPAANPVGSGGLYNNQKGKSAPSEKADRPVGEWNDFRVIMIGDRVSVYLNDKFVVDNVVLENYWERDKPIYPTGQIELQAHGNPLWFRNVYVREIPRDQAPPQITEAEAADGFAPLFNGRDLDGWTGDTKGYAAENGKIVIHPELGSGNLYTAKEYADFTLRFEFKLTPAANNGLGVRAPLEGDAAYVGMELQILEDGSPVYWGLRPYQYHGSIYGVVPARRGFLRPPGEWNAEEVTVKGRHVTVAVNGITIVDADLDQASANGTIDHNEHPGLKRTTGHIGFLGHGAIVEFRNIRLKEIR
jgi:HEAT repeat protein